MAHMETNELLRGKGWSLKRKTQAQGPVCGALGYQGQARAAEWERAVFPRNRQAARGITGWPLWLAGKTLVELRDFYLFTLLRRPRHPKNIYG